MTEWNKYPETFPTTEGRLLVVINNEIIVGRSFFNTKWYYLSKEFEIIFLINQKMENVPGSEYLIRYVAIGGEWIKPK